MFEHDREFSPAAHTAAPATVCRLPVRRVPSRMRVGPADDVYERDAERVARAVVERLAKPSVANSAAGATVCGDVRSEPAPPVAGPIQRRSTASPVGAEGGDVDSDTAAEIRRRVGRGRPIEPAVRRNMERGFGADFSAVRLHGEPEASALNARLGARAFTVGADVFFADGVPDLQRSAGRHLLAHELTHTIQQASAPIVQRAAIGDRPFADGYAGLIGTPAWHQHTDAFERRLGAYAYQHPRSLAAARKAVGRMVDVLDQYYSAQFADLNDLMRTAFFKDDTTSAGQVGKGLSDSEQIAMLLGGGGNLRELMTAFYNAAYYNAGYGANLNPSLKAILHDVTLNRNWKLGADLKLDVDSLRERSSALLGWGRSLKEKAIKLAAQDKAHIFAQDIFALGELAGSVANAAELGRSQIPRSDRTDVDKQQGAAKKTPATYAVDGAPLSQRERDYLISKDKPLQMKGVDVEEVAWEDWDLGPDGLPTLSDADRQRGVSLSVNYEYDDQNHVVTYPDGSPGIASVFRLIPATKTVSGTRQSDLQPGEEGPEFPLEWIEGKAWFQLDPSSTWYRDVQQRLGVEVVAGVSGTTTRMMSAMKWLKAPGLDPMDFRLAIMGWMLTSEDHSLYEIFRGSAFAGFQGGEDTTDAVRMYMNVPPLSLAELRSGVCKDRMFPHEHAYLGKVTEGVDDVADIDSGARAPGPIGGFAEPGEDLADTGVDRWQDLLSEATAPGSGSTELTKWLADIGRTAPELADRLSPAHTVALAGYTGGMHALLNTVLTMPALIAKQLLKAKLRTTLAYFAERGHLEMIPAKLGRGLTPTETARLKHLRDHYEEWTATLDLLGRRATVRDDMCDPTKSADARATALTNYQARADALVGPLYEELKVHATMTVEALSALPPVAGTTVFRGDWMGVVSWTYGSDSLSVTQLMSTTTDEAVAEEFAERYEDKALAHPVLLRMHLTGKGGRNIGFLSDVQSEQEILLMPGTKFRVQRRRTVSGVERVDLIEV